MFGLFFGLLRQSLHSFLAMTEGKGAFWIAYPSQACNSISNGKKIAIPFIMTGGRYFLDCVVVLRTPRNDGDKRISAL
jgi:hypothetical protein